MERARATAGNAGEAGEGLMGWMRMRYVLVRVLVALALMLGLGVCPGATAYAQVATTTLTDTIYHADGTAATGSVIVSWGSFTTGTGNTVPAGTRSVTIGAGGVLSVALAPNAGANPIGSYYTAVYHLDDGSVQREFWVIPVSQYPVRLSAVKSTVVPTSVAMQTVTKNYVDTAIAAAVTGHPLDSSPYVVKSGDTMTGALVLPGDPVSSNQAADKHYVDIAVAGLTSGGSGKVSVNPTTTQVVNQPTGTDLETSRFNQVEYASQYETGLGNNGVSNAVASPDCTAASAAGLGCMVMAEPGLAAGELLYPPTWPNATHVVDDRLGAHHELFFNPRNPQALGDQAGHVITVESTESTQAISQATGAQDVQSAAVEINHFGLAGGSNLFPEQLEVPPYFKSNYVALAVTGTYNTIGQHVLAPMATNCFAIGDCLIGSQTLNSTGGYRDSADEGTHPFDLQVREDPRVFQGTCSTGCTTGSTSVLVGAQQNPSTQGEGRFLIDKNPAKTITSGVLLGGSGGGNHPSATFSGTSFPVSTFFQTAALIPSQTSDIAPGTVTFQVATSGVPAGYSTNTASAPSGTGVACVSDRALGGAPQNYEMGTYTVVDGTHLRMTLAKPHGPLSTVAMGGLCGYGVEQTVDTVNGIRQVFPVIGSTSATSLIYSGAQSALLGIMGGTSAFQNISLTILSETRNNNVVTVTFSGNLFFDLNGVTLTVAGASDASYNGSFPVTTTGSSTFTYAQSGANSSSTGGTASLLTGGYVLYPMAEVVSVYNPGTKQVDGLMTLAPNNVAWAANDPVEEPHYWQIIIAGDTEFINQTTPRPGLLQQLGYEYDGNNGPGLRGFQITNASPFSNYLGNGGTHSYPDVAYAENGVWKRTFEVQAGEQAVMTVHCNSKGCGRWSSGYNLFELDSSAGSDTMTYLPQNSNLYMSFRGTGYSFTPQAFTAGTANIRTLNVGTINVTSMAMDTVTMAAATAGVVKANTLIGALDASNVSSGTMAAARLPLMGASGANHAVGAVPDPGTTGGTTRFLREDGTWAAPAGGGSSGGGGGSGAGGPLAVAASLNAGLLADYNFFQQSGTTLTDVSGNGNDGTLESGSLAPTWTGTGLAFLPGQGVSLPAALNPSKSFVIEVYLNPLTAAGQVPDAYPSLVTNSLGGSGLGLLTDYEVSVSNYAGNYTYAPAIFGGGGHQTAAPNLVSGFHVMGYVLGTGGSDVDHLYIDGSEVQTYQRQGAAAGLQSSGNLYFGAANVQPWSSSGLNGTAYRMRTYSRQLSAAEVATLTQAMQGEAAQRGVATTVVPVNQAAPQFHAIGDSITFGFLAPAPWPSLMTLTNQPNYTITNWGIVGIPLQALSGSEANRVAPRCKSAAGPSVAVVFAGTNDFALLYGATLQSTFGYLLSEVQTLKTAGCRVFVGTMISRTGADGAGNSLDADKNAFNGLILSQAKLGGADGVIDFAADARLGADGANAGPAFGPDHVHPLALGQQILANEASNALNYYFGASDGNPTVVTTLPHSMVAGDGYVSLSGLGNAGALTLPDCTGQSGASYRVNNPQSTYAVTVGPLNSGQTINGLTSGVVVPANGTVTLRDVPNARSVGGCHWEM